MTKRQLRVLYRNQFKGYLEYAGLLILLCAFIYEVMAIGAFLSA